MRRHVAAFEGADASVHTKWIPSPLTNPRFEHQQFHPLSTTGRGQAAATHLIDSNQKSRAIPDGLPEKTFRVQVSREGNALDRLHSLNPRLTSLEPPGDRD